MANKFKIGHPQNGKDSLTRLWVKFHLPSPRPTYVYFSRDWRSASSGVKNQTLGISRLEQNIILAKRGRYELAILYDNFSNNVIAVYDALGTRMTWEEYSASCYRNYPVGKNISYTRLWVRFKEKKDRNLHKTFTYHSNDFDVKSGEKNINTGISRLETNVLQGSARDKFLEARLYSNETDQILIRYDQSGRKTTFYK